MKQGEDRDIKSAHLVRALQQRHWPQYRMHNNVVGMAYGRREAHGERTDEPALVVYVMKKVPERFLTPSGTLPRRIFLGGDSIEVDVVETGPLFPQMFVARERPTTHGISIGNAIDGGSGTIGGIVIDNTDGAQVLISNNHVLARRNLAAVGEVIIQQGGFDGGADPADRIGRLRRFVMINANGNRADVAIAVPDKANDILDQVHNNIIGIADANHPAVGLLFAGSCGRTLINPINDVLNQINCVLPNGAAATAVARIGDNVEKVGRTTEYTSSTVKEVNATVQIDYSAARDGSDVREFDGQITTGWMSDPGDSGSLVYLGGDGGDESHCECGTTSAASSVLGKRLRSESSMAKDVRDNFLRQTKIGRWAVDLFYANEESLLQRLRATSIAADDKDYARKTFDRFGDEARQVFLVGVKSDQRVTEQHLREARQALKRAQAYMQPSEVEASKELLAIANEHAKGRSAPELLALLNDDKLFERLKGIAAKVKTLRQPGDCC